MGSMSRRYAFLSLLLLLPVVAQGATDDFVGMRLYIIDPTLSSISVDLNLTSSVEYDMAVVSTNNYDMLLQGVRSSVQLQNYSYIIAYSNQPGNDKLSYSGDMEGLYLLVYSPEVLFGNAIEGTFFLSGTPVDRAEFTRFGERTFEYLHGNEVTVSDNNTMRYAVYSMTYEAGKPVEMFASSSDSDLMLFIDDNRSKIDQEFVTTLVNSYPSFMNGSVPENIADFASFSGDGGYLRYNATSSVKLSVVVVFLNSYSGDGKTYLYFATNVKANKDRSADWYNAWFVNLVKGSAITHPPIAAFFLVIISIFTSLLSAFVTRKLVDMEELNKFQKQINRHNKLKNKARDTADKLLWAKVQSKDKRITELQQKIMMKRMLPQLFLSLPFIAIFTTLRGSIGDRYLNLTPDRGGVVAVFPFQIPSWFPLFGGWVSRYISLTELSAVGFGFMYFLSAIVSSTLIQKIFGINLQGARPENPFQQ